MQTTTSLEEKKINFQSESPKHKMENIYKIKIRTDPDPRGLYPSERRYSASTVLGLGVIHICFAILALIFASLSLINEPYYTKESILKLLEDNVILARNKEAVNYISDKEISDLNQEEADADITSENATSTGLNNESETGKLLFNKTMERRKRDIMNSLESIPRSYLTIATFVMTLGSLLVGLTGLLAWKRWYIDNNIKWLFLMSCISTVTSCLSLIFTIITIIIVYEKIDEISRYLNTIPHFKLGLSVHILIAAILEFLWSVLSIKISFQGMQNTYPDDIMVSKNRGKVEVNTVRKGNKKMKIVPPDILNHFHMTEKFAKYFPRRESNYLPNAESNSEYQERVRRFLSSHVDASSVK